MRIAASGKIQHGGGRHLEFSLKYYLWVHLGYQVEIFALHITVWHTVTVVDF